jgi:hypothetical protein
MGHPTEDDLILHCYGEQSADEAARLDAHLRACVTCSDTWRELKETLQLVDAAGVPEPGPAFERLMWMRIAPSLPAGRPARRRLGRWLVPLAAAAAATLAIVIFRPQPRPAAPRPDSPVASAATPEAVERAQQAHSRRVLYTALDGHFAQAELLLIELLNGQGGAIEFERATADELLADGRLYRITAQQTGDTTFAAMLDDLEPVLVEVAGTPATPAPKDLDVLRTRIDDNGLLFKVRAVTYELRERQQELTTVTPNEGEL